MNLMTPRAADYDPFSKEVMANPLPFYEALRAHSPIHYLPQYDTFAISRFEDIIDVLSLGDNTFIGGMAWAQENGGVAGPPPNRANQFGPLNDQPGVPICSKKPSLPERNGTRTLLC